jgi:chitin synthase
MSGRWVSTLGLNANDPTTAQFLDTNLSDVFKQQSGQDITKQIDSVLAAMDPQTRNENVNCLKRVLHLISGKLQGVKCRTSCSSSSQQF